MKKLLNFVLFGILMVVGSSFADSALASCSVKAGGTCGQGGLGNFECIEASFNAPFCCTEYADECNNPPTPVPIVPTTCPGGLTAGQTTCDPNDDSKYLLCSPTSPDPFIVHDCPNNRMCREGQCVERSGQIGESCFSSTDCYSNYCFKSDPALPGYCQNPPTSPQPGDDLVTGKFLLGVDPLSKSVGGVFYKFQTPGGILNVLMPFLFVFAGMILFVMLLWGGFEMLSSAATPDSKNAGQQRITAAIIGFVLLFVSYWIAQIVQFITGVNVLG